MRNKREEIIAEFAKIDGVNVKLDNAFEYLDSFTHYEESQNHNTASYVEVWEHPKVTKANEALNDTKMMLSHTYFTLYELKPEHEPNEFQPAFKFIYGRMGNTRVFNID